MLLTSDKSQIAKQKSVSTRISDSLKTLSKDKEFLNSLKDLSEA